MHYFMGITTQQHFTAADSEQSRVLFKKALSSFVCSNEKGRSVYIYLTLLSSMPLLTTTVLTVKDRREARV